MNSALTGAGAATSPTRSAGQVPAGSTEQSVFYKGRFSRLVLVTDRKIPSSSDNQFIYKVPLNWVPPSYDTNTTDQKILKAVSARTEDTRNVKQHEKELSFLKRLRHENICILAEGPIVDAAAICHLYHPYVLQNLLDDFDETGTRVSPASLGNKEVSGEIGPVDIDYKILNQLCIGLRYLHGYNIIHGAVCPANILITDRGVIKITDLSDAATTGEEFSKHDNESVELAYLSPDRGASLATHRTVHAAEIHDWWAAGIVGLQIYKRKSHVLAATVSDVTAETFLCSTSRATITEVVEQSLAKIKAELDEKHQTITLRVQKERESTNGKDVVVSYNKGLAKAMESDLKYFEMPTVFLKKWLINAPEEYGFSHGASATKLNFSLKQPPFPNLAYTEKEPPVDKPTRPLVPDTPEPAGSEKQKKSWMEDLQYV
ncbi:protein kinase domain-containing protein [Parendozoicomonas haliclonae]|uniref:Protein kinase domain protein n=1 Tax=Parendozoicomonas haliclonae TaxID=1960125 RepID=A0A1X7AQ13_9GAMM|nr:protein kinase [Parendozoicomonas haliclonae]SMA50212.1 Protein kinase domain protein [Parendozoicomonas haliclonae]